MKTLLFAPMYLEGVDLTGSSRLERNQKWLRYYLPLKDKLNYNNILMVDNVSTEENIQLIKNEFPLINIFNNKIHFDRISEHAYPYWYRAFAQAINYAIVYDYQKIIHLDTDVFVLNDKICNYIKNVSSGWISFWSEIHKYPDSTIQIINKDQFHIAYEFMTEKYLTFYPYKLVEDQIPWTHVERAFVGDRYGDYDNRPQTPDMDYYGQCRVDRELIFV